MSYFSQHLQEPLIDRPNLYELIFRTLSYDGNVSISSSSCFTKIDMTIFQCDMNKSRGPDSFNFF